MKVSELARHSGLPIATIKYYLREGLLPPGRRTSANQAEYGQEHLARLNLIKALGEVPGLPIQKIGQILGIIDEDPGDLLDGIARASRALPPYQHGQDDTHEPASPGSHPLARNAMEHLALEWEGTPSVVAQLDQALETAASAGMPLEAARLQAYAEHMRAIAEYEVATLPEDRQDALAYAVAGTVLYEPVLLALRRLALQGISVRALRPGTPQG